jgi:pimeloyl-ACP methyl ester carboxylesterase
VSGRRATRYPERGWVRVDAGGLSVGGADHDVHAAHWPAAPEGSGRETFVCVHGLGGSHANWDLLAPQLAQHGDVWCPDLAGFGLTEPAGRRATIEENLDLLAGFVRTVAPDARPIVLGNSMGGLLSVMLAARFPELAGRLVLMGPALPRPRTRLPDPQVTLHFAAMMLPYVGQWALDRRVRTTTPEQQAAQTLRLCAADMRTLDPAVVATHADLVARRRAMPHAHPSFLEAARSLLRAIALSPSGVWRDVERVRVPTMLIHGARDRLVSRHSIDLVASKRPDWEFRRYPDLGHIPMLEDPGRVRTDLEGWLASQPA